MDFHRRKGGPRDHRAVRDCELCPRRVEGGGGSPPGMGREAGREGGGIPTGRLQRHKPWLPYSIARSTGSYRSLHHRRLFRFFPFGLGLSKGTRTAVYL